MLISAIQGFSDEPVLTVIQILTLIIVLLIALTVHEYSHARMAFALGDRTALYMGRLSLNPLKHLDPVGALMLLLFGFGFAKPVPINARNFTKVSYKTGLVLVSLAGPVSNFILAFIGIILMHIMDALYAAFQFGFSFYLIASFFFTYFTLMNIGLGVFNLIPVPPLDGSRILTVFLPVKLQLTFFKYEQYIQLVLFFLLWRGTFDGILYTLRALVYNGMDFIVSLIPFL